MQLGEHASLARETRTGASRTWLTNTWYGAAWSTDLAPGTLLARTILNENIVLARHFDGSLAAYADWCPHRFAPLSFGKLTPTGNLQCGYHGLQYNAGGKCVLNPHGNHTISANLSVRTYPMCERHGVAWIWPGSDTPDESKLPDFGLFDDRPPLFISNADYLYVKSPYTLLQDNLMDASHLPYVHIGTLASNADEMLEPEAELEQDGDQVSITRSFLNTKVLTIIDQMYRSNGRPGDTWNTIRWDPPCSTFIFSTANEPGADRTTGTGLGAMHLLTPETETTTHYFFRAARYNPRDPDEAASRQILEVMNVVRRRAFEEQDLPIIEAQARTVARLDPSHRPSMLFTDAAAIRVQRVLDRLIAAES